MLTRGIEVKKSLKLWAGILVWAVLGILMAFAVLLVMSTFDLGVRAFVISSGSMEPGLPAGGLVFVRSAGQYHEGDIITFSTRGGGYVTHRVYEIRDEGGRTVYITKGDANDAPDINPVEEERVKGRVVFHLPYIGYAAAWFRTWPGAAFLVLVIAALLFYLIYGLREGGKGVEEGEPPAGG
jgi:signal peptidase I